MRTLRFRLFLILSLAALLTPLLADEGLWPFNLVPIKVIKEKYGIALTPEWIEHVQLSCAILGGSSSFVSPDGLLITNHHVGARAIQNLSTKDSDLIKNGFYAKSLADELRCPGFEVKVLEEIEDVTSQVQGGFKAGMAPAEAGSAMRKTIAEIERKASAGPGLNCEVVKLYAGALFHLYKYRIYTDVRLVFAPEDAMPLFGGDPDNYGYPRFCLDIAFFRVYENGKPLKTTNYLKWNTSGLKEGELVFTAGNPAFTYRLLTYSQMEFLRDVEYPMVLKKYIAQRDYFTEFSQKGQEEARLAGRDLWGAMNEVKCFTGMLSGLHDKEIMSEKLKDEKEMREAVDINPDLRKNCAVAWDEIAKVRKSFASFFKPYFFFVEGEGLRSTYIRLAQDLVHLAYESEPAARNSLAARILSPRPFDTEFEIARLTQSFLFLKSELGNHALVQEILGPGKPEDRAREIIMKSQLNDIGFLKRLAEGKAADILSSADPAIRLARLIEPIKKDLQARYQKEVESVEDLYGAQISRILFELKGTTIAPDATHTLRLSYGQVKSYHEDDGSFVPFQTTFGGLYERSDKAQNKEPYYLPQSYLRARSKVDLDAPVNFVTTCDSSGGNSGSPVINGKGEFVGILFDGNRQSLPHRFLYSDKQVRSVQVHALGIVEALRKVYQATRLVDELMGSN